MKARIITARIDEQIIFQIDYIKRHLKADSTTQVLKTAVSSLYGAIKQQELQKSPFALLEELQLIGCFEGEQELSQIYKSDISDSLHKKHRSSPPKLLNKSKKKLR